MTETPTVYSDLELLKKRFDSTDIEGIAILDALAIQLQNRDAEIERLREYEWKYNDLCD